MFTYVYEKIFVENRIKIVKIKSNAIFNTRFFCLDLIYTKSGMVRCNMCVGWDWSLPFLLLFINKA